MVHQDKGSSTVIILSHLAQLPTLYWDRYKSSQYDMAGLVALGDFKLETPPKEGFRKVGKGQGSTV